MVGQAKVLGYWEQKWAGSCPPSAANASVFE